MSIPYWAPLPIPTMIAVGVARPKAQGHAATRTAMVKLSAVVHCIATTIVQNRNVANARTRITGVKTPAIASAFRWIGGLFVCASSTILTICESTVSCPTFSARTRKTPFLFTVPPTTESPTSLSTGNGSPVIIDSSTEDLPSRTRPSTGTRSPGLIRTTSSTSTSSIGRVISCPSRTTIATFACRSMRLLIALEVLPFAMASSVRPRRMNVISRTAVS